MDTMRATVFHGINDIRTEEVPRPHPGPGEIETVRNGRVDLTPLLTHTFKREEIVAADILFASRRDNVLKVKILP